MEKKRLCGLWLIILSFIVFGLGDVCQAEEKIYEGDFVINSPGQVKALSGYTEVTGDLIIGSVPNFVYLIEDPELINENALLGFEPSLLKVNNLDGLESLTSIGGDLRIGGPGWLDVPMPNPKLRNIDGLRNLKSVGGNVRIANNRSLKDVNGLKSLETIGGQLLISQNLVLANLDGLNYVTTVGGGLCIQYHTLLEHISGFNNLTFVGGGVKIRYNRSLKDIKGMDNLPSITSLQIHENNFLESIIGFSQVRFIGDGLWTYSPEYRLKIYENPRLEHMVLFDAHIRLGGDLFITCNHDDLDSDRDGLLDRLRGDDWGGCWDFTCDDTDNPICPEVE